MKAILAHWRFMILQQALNIKLFSSWFALQADHITAQSCFQTFPVIAGGQLGSTVFTCMDVDLFGNVAVGGYSSDPTLVNTLNVPNPIAQFILQGGAIKWSISMNTNFNEVTAIKFTPNTEKLILALDTQQGQNLVFVVLQSISGAVIDKYQMQGSGSVAADGIQYFDDGNVYAAMQYQQKWTFMKFSTITSPPSNSIFFLQHGIVFASINVINTDGRLLSSFGYFQGFNPNAMYSYDRIKMVQKGSNYYLWTCGSKSDSSSIIVSLVLLTDLTTFIFQTFQAIALSFTSCIQIAPVDDTRTYYLFYKAGSIMIGWFKINDSQNRIQFYRVSQLNSDTRNKLFHGIQQSGQNFYYVGQMFTLNTNPARDYTSGNSLSVGLFQFTGATTSSLFYTIIVQSNSQTTWTVLTASGSFLSDLAFNQESQFVPLTTYDIVAQIDNQPSLTISADLSNQVYLIGQATLTYTFESFKITQPCSDIRIYHEIEGNVPSFIKVNMQAKTFSIYSNDENDVGDYTISIRATINNGQYLISAFKVLIKTACESSQIYQSEIQQQTYIVNEDEISYQFDAFQSSNNNCEINYEMLNNNGNPIDKLLIKSFSSSLRLITIYTQDEGLVGTHVFFVRGYFKNAPDVKQDSQFTIDIKSKCFGNKLYPQQIGDVVYDYNENQLVTISEISWGQRYAEDCPQLVYLLYDEINNSLDEEIFMLKDNKRIKMQTQDNEKSGTYQLKLVGKSLRDSIEYQQESVTFKVLIRDGCPLASVQTFKPDDQIYNIDESPLVFAFDQWIPSTLTCGEVSYKLSNADDSNLIDAFIMDSNVRSITVKTSNLELANVYQLKLTGKLGERGPEKVVLFQIEFFFTDFDIKIENKQLCGGFAYEVSGISNSQLDDSITYNQEQKSFQIKTSDETKSSLTPYYIKIKGFQSNYPQNYLIMDILVRYLIDCQYQDAKAPENYLQTYTVMDPIALVNYGQFKLTLSSCQLVYICTDQETSSSCDSNIFNFDSNSGQLKVYSEDNNNARQYNLQIQGKTATCKNVQYATSLYLEDNTEIQDPEILSAVVVDQDNGRITVKSQNINLINTSVTVVLKAVEESGVEITQQFELQFQEKTTTTTTTTTAPPQYLSKSPMKITINSESKIDAQNSPYVIQIVGLVKNPDGTKIQTTLFLPLNIQSQNLGAPYFQTSLSGIYYFKNASRFITGQYPNYRLTPNYNNLGEFQVSIAVTDDNLSPLTANYYFKIVVTKMNSSQNKNETKANQTQNQNLKVQLFFNYFSDY
ncbi:UNKNOWN [Stylonychia lemnae]|uniref:Uncharacterized protein n=1 Tax=Stylonychia lemnae TaxID=5949 RepID=A0A078AX71_STYLE|nr:UNKNOWN [Stylonychia lemnae]|eukprot:CDW87050.1 UNKNOWN [Stylonychia lemnae]